MHRVYTSGPHGEAIAQEPLVKAGVNITYNVTSAFELSKALRTVYHDLYEPAEAPAQIFDEWGSPLPGKAVPEPDYFDRYEEGIIYGARSKMKPFTLLAMRMRWGVYAEPLQQSDMGLGNGVPFDHVSLHVGSEKVFVFIVTAGKQVTIEDEIKLFPSDTLITQLKMLEPPKE